MLRATILYEDQARDGEVKEFGLHNLVIRCVHDRWSVSDRFGDFYAFRRLRVLEGMPKKGNTRLKSACDKDHAKLTRSGPLFVVYDRDEIYRPLKIPATACIRSIRDKLLSDCANDPLVRIVLIEQNTESLLEAIRDNRLVARAPDIYTRAIEGKETVLRDEIFNNLAQQNDADNRAALQTSVVSFQYLIDRLIQLLFPAPFFIAP